MLFAGKFQSLPREKRAVFRSMRAIQWATLEVSTSWVREMTPMPILFGGIIAACVRMLIKTSGGELMSKNASEIWDFF